VSTAPPKLSRRESEVAKLVAEGMTSREIGEKLFISERTAEGHVEQIRNKLGFRTRAQIAAWVAAGASTGSPPAPTPVAREVQRSPVNQRVARRWIWVAGGSMALIALGIVTVTLLVPALTVAAPGPRIETFAGTGFISVSPEGKPARSTDLIAPDGIAVGNTGEVYFADGNRIRVVGSDGHVNTVAGTGAPGFFGDQGPALTARLSIGAGGSAEVIGLAIDRKGDIFFSDTSNDRVREITPDGIIRTIAGGGRAGSSFQGPPPSDVGDGRPGTKAILSQPRGLALDDSGNLYIADTLDNRVRRLDPNGIITTVAGNGAMGWSGDGLPANMAELSAPEGLAVDAAGNLFVADTANERIRKITDGVISTVAGTGSSGFSGDGGPGPKAKLNVPMGVAVDNRGNLYIADAANFVVRKLDLSGTITSVAGNGQAGFDGDSGLATSAMLNVPVAIAITGSGDLYISDSGNNRIRLVRLGGA
jgi:DNA-binding CsgD family transcriptional regulator/sugar lactone lactonase YvrE